MPCVSFPAVRTEVAKPFCSSDSPVVAGAFRPPTTMNLLSALDAPAAEEPNDVAKATTEDAKEHDQQTSENTR